jgi:hypothetical protein
MGYMMALVTVRHPLSHNAAATIAPLLVAMLLLMRNPKAKQV